MPVSAADAALIADMKLREQHAKGMQRAIDAVLHEARRFRGLLVALAGVVGAAVAAGLFVLLGGDDSAGWIPHLLLVLALGAVVGVLLGQQLLRTPWGRRRIDRKLDQLYTKYASELHAGRRWRRFYYRDEDIAPFIPQILYFIEGEGRFDSVDEALAFAKEHRQVGDPFAERALSRFEKVAAETNVLIVSGADPSGTPTSRAMRFVKSDRPGVWYVTSAPEGHRVHEFQQGRIAVITRPSDSGATISSNRVRVSRAPFGFAGVADLYRAQVPGFVDRLTEEDQERELVYEIALRSAKVDSWLEHDIVNFE